MKKYTIIYGEYFQVGSCRNSTPKIQHIKCNPVDLVKTIELHTSFGNVWFILDGHCKQTKD